jgi:sugar lactone lactonase YvrE
MRNEVRCVSAAKAVMGEGPYWDITDQRLYWVDIKGKRIHRFDPQTGRDANWPTPEVIGSLAVRENGGLIVALKSGLYFFDLDTAAVTLVALPSVQLHPARNRFNDGKVDRQGRFWTGSMDDSEREPTGGLFRLDGQLHCKRSVDSFRLLNSIFEIPPFISSRSGTGRPLDKEYFSALRLDQAPPRALLLQRWPRALHTGSRRRFPRPLAD